MIYINFNFFLYFFFLWTAWVEGELRNDRLLAPHYRYYVRQIRILAYSQLLESYRSLTLDYMAQAFGVSTTFIDKWAYLSYLYSSLALRLGADQKIVG